MKRKLKLSRETLRNLEEMSLLEAAGGAAVTTDFTRCGSCIVVCSNTCATCRVSCGGTCQHTCFGC